MKKNDAINDVLYEDTNIWPIQKHVEPIQEFASINTISSFIYFEL